MSEPCFCCGVVPPEQCLPGCSTRAHEQRTSNPQFVCREGHSITPDGALKIRALEKQIERLAAHAEKLRDKWIFERDSAQRLQAQDEVHWKTRRSLVAERDRLRSALREAANWIEYDPGNELGKRIGALLAGAADEDHSDST